MSTVTKLDYYDMAVCPFFNAGALFIYDKFFEKQSTQNAMKDAGIMGLSTLGTRIVNDLLVSKTLDQFGGESTEQITSILVQPAINTLLYSQGYEKLYKPSNQNLIGNIRSDQQTYGIGFVGGLSSYLLRNPLLEFLTGLQVI